MTRRNRTCEVLELVLMWSPLPNRLMGTGAGGGHAGVGGMYNGGGDRSPPLYNNKHGELIEVLWNTTKLVQSSKFQFVVHKYSGIVSK